MEIAANILGPLVLAASEGGEDEGGAFLVTPELGLAVWTLIAFFAAFFILKRYAFPLIGDFLDERANLIAKNIEESKKEREEAEALLAEYRARLKEAREQADDITARARKAADAAKEEATKEGRAKREELVAAAERDIEAATRRSLDQIRKEVADLTVLATEKVTRKSLDGTDHKRLVEEALQEADFRALSGSSENGS